ncbi:hypothetical protein BTW15_19875 [Pseudomonas syringae pv. tomato]|uniref:Uncharacterized protein n=8 Tax=Pseudomonas syringae group TaxID=136849 RepID=A0AAW4DVV4_PSESX|nr:MULTISPECIES: hypothetical protein [Pseudomonas]KPC07953.1 Uncharacterized protein AC500_1808 [Pseudomonas amygdali pv. lachrymans]AAO57764.1 protein of unknown function [Pseudomonas syringae pv. tomato str. DC3000]AVI86352.1 hypothetical protein XJ28_22980 [Pseudomonas syringae pv. tomato]EEB58514.1 hypothetical protein PSPTOT1_2589 [Pseudomonas syringae pv. tomato T1]EGH98073.1 hypothetical protein PLA106_18404 [Pseudomonas amygdali pv. lachrymans str. M302278]
MTDPLDKATSTAPATLGEGCLSRYDPAALTPENGADFDGAAALWRELQQSEDTREGEGAGEVVTEGRKE